MSRSSRPSHHTVSKNRTRRCLRFNLGWSTFESYAKEVAFAIFPYCCCCRVVKPKVTWLAKSSEAVPERQAPAGSDPETPSKTSRCQQRWRHPNPEMNHDHANRTTIISPPIVALVVANRTRKIFSSRRAMLRTPLARQQWKKKNVIPKIWKGRQLAIQKFGHDEKGCGAIKSAISS